eukprot:6317530-Prymnesium_polylepis.1
MSRAGVRPRRPHLCLSVSLDSTQMQEAPDARGRCTKRDSLHALYRITARRASAAAPANTDPAASHPHTSGRSPEIDCGSWWGAQSASLVSASRASISRPHRATEPHRRGSSSKNGSTHAAGSYDALASHAMRMQIKRCASASRQKVRPSPLPATHARARSRAAVNTWHWSSPAISLASAVPHAAQGLAAPARVVAAAAVVAARGCACDRAVRAHPGRIHLRGRGPFNVGTLLHQGRHGPYPPRAG